MSAGLQAVRDELRVLARLYGARRGGDYKGLSLAVIDHAATRASDRYGEMPDDVLAGLTAAMRAAGRRDVAGVIEVVERALALLGGHRQKPKGPPAHAKSLSHQRLGARSTRSNRAAPATRKLAETIDPLLARLRNRRPPKQ